jgi:hypothetical protein
LARRPAGASAFRPERPAPYLGDEVVDRELPVPLAYGRGRTVALEQRKGSSTCGGMATRYSITARTGGELGAAQALATIFSHQQPPPLAFGGNRSGTALAAWIEFPRDARGRCVTTRGEVLRVAVHRDGAGFGTPVTLIRRLSSTLLAVAVGERGDMVVAVRRKDGFETRLRDVAGRWHAARRLRIGDMRVDSARAAIAPDGAAWLLWSNADTDVRTVSAAVRKPHTIRFGRVRVLERSPLSGTLLDSPLRWRLRLTTPERGTGATAAWTSFDGEHLRVMVALARGDDPLEAPVPLTPAGEDQTLADLAQRAGRRAIATLAGPLDDTTQPMVAIAGGIAPFGPLEPVGEPAGRVSGAAIAIDATTRQPTLAWIESRATTAAPQTRVMASTRR